MSNKWYLSERLNKALIASKVANDAMLAISITIMRFSDQRDSDVKKEYNKKIANAISLLNDIIKRLENGTEYSNEDVGRINPTAHLVFVMMSRAAGDKVILKNRLSSCIEEMRNAIRGETITGDSSFDALTEIYEAAHEIVDSSKSSLIVA